MTIDDKTIIADALNMYADSLAHATEWLAVERARSAPTLAARARRAREIAFATNQSMGRGATPDPFELSPSARTALAANNRA